MKKFFLIAAVALGAFAVTPANAAPFKLCTGAKDLNYNKAGHILKKHVQGVDVIETKGSIDNLDKLTNGECDGAFVQSDALMVYSARNSKAISSLERVNVLYSEQAHLLCNRDLKIKRMVDLNETNTVAIGPEGSGANTTWAAFVQADKKRYGKVMTSPRSGNMLLAGVADGSSIQCGLIVTALNASFLKQEAQKDAYAERIVLVGTDDYDMANNAKDGRGKPVYTYGEIPADTYPKVQPSGSIYGTKAVPTIKLDAVFVVNVNWMSANEADMNKIIAGFANAKPEIGKLVEPK